MAVLTTLIAQTHYQYSDRQKIKNNLFLSRFNPSCPTRKTIQRSYSNCETGSVNDNTRGQNRRLSAGSLALYSSHLSTMTSPRKVKVYKKNLFIFYPLSQVSDNSGQMMMTGLAVERKDWNMLSVPSRVIRYQDRCIFRYVHLKY